MGYTEFTKSKVQPLMRKGMSVVELGSQQDHTMPRKPYMNKWFDIWEASYACIDLNGENDAMKLNLGELQLLDRSYNLVTNIGTFEHVAGPDGKFSWDASYRCWLNMFAAAYLGGVIYSESPQTGSWPGHGVAYLTTEFIYQICENADLEILDIGLHPACHNTKNGWNVWCTLSKTGPKFVSQAVFETFNLRTS